MDKSVILETDASERGYGGVLMQEQNGKREYVSFYSKCYTGAESRYSTVEKELLAVVKSIEHFKEYLMGRKFKPQAYTDHKPLKTLMSKENLSSRLVRWMLRIQSYDVEIVYKPGVENSVADWLSPILLLGTVEENHEENLDIVSVIAEARKAGRPKGSKNKFKVRSTVLKRSARNKPTVQCNEQSEDESNTEEVESEVEKENEVNKEILPDNELEENTRMERNLKREQQIDEDIAWLCRQLELENAELPNNTVQKQLLTIKEKCFVRDGILLYTHGEEEEKQELVVLPSQLVDEVIGNMHNAVYSGHLGVNKTWGKVKERFCRPGLATAVKEYIKYCMICQTVKVNMTPRVAKPGRQNLSFTFPQVLLTPKCPLYTALCREKFSIGIYGFTV
jgi:hypothetical protein